MADEEFAVCGYVRKGIGIFSLILGKYRNGAYILLRSDSRKAQAKQMEGGYPAMDNQVIQQLYEAYGKEILRYLYSLCSNWARAEDLLQDTFVKALLSLPAQHTNLRAWLYMVARNLCFNEMKKEKRQFPAEDNALREKAGQPETGADGILAGLMKQEQDRMLQCAMARLPLVKREVLQLQYFSGLPLKEVARILQISPENARVLSHRAKCEMRKYLEEEGYGIS